MRGANVNNSKSRCVVCTNVFSVHWLRGASYISADSAVQSEQDHKSTAHLISSKPEYIWKLFPLSPSQSAVPMPTTADQDASSALMIFPSTDGEVPPQYELIQRYKASKNTGACDPVSKNIFGNSPPLSSERCANVNNGWFRCVICTTVSSSLHCQWGTSVGQLESVSENIVWKLTRFPQSKSHLLWAMCEKRLGLSVRK